MDAIRCDTCGVEDTAFARGWRAYVVALADDVQLFYVACPDCAELYGEDEVPVADRSRSE